MTVSDRKRGRALDGDPTLMSSSFSPQSSNNRNPSVLLTKTWEEEEGEGEDVDDGSSFEVTRRLTKTQPFLIVSDYDEISSIDRPLEMSGVMEGPIMHSSHTSDEPSDEGNSPPSMIQNGASPKANLVTPEKTEKKESSATSPSSPLRYRRSNTNHRRSLAQKILMSRRKANAKNDSGEGRGGINSSPKPLSLSPGKSKNMSHTLGTPHTNSGASGTMGFSPQHPRLFDSADVFTRAPDSDSTASWASTLTTDPSRLVTPTRNHHKLLHGADENTRQVPYFRMETLPSVQETEEPQGKLERHFQQQRSVSSSSAASQSKQKASLRDTALRNQDAGVPPREDHPATDDATPWFLNSNRDVPQRQEVDSSARADWDERDDHTPLTSAAVPLRRTHSGSQAELSEIYRQSASLNHTNARSDPGGSLSPLATAAARWQQFSDSRPSPLINYGNTADVLVTLHPGGETFEHSSHILAYASPVLRQKLEPVLGGWYRLNLHQTSTVEWQLIQPFLEPHSVQNAVVTPSNLSYLLPWFVQLQLDILLVECDQLLVTLEFPKAHKTENADTSMTSDKSSSTPQLKDMVDVLLVAEISSLAQLKNTLESSLQILESYLVLHPGLAANNEALPIMMRLLQDHPSIRQRLWRRSLVRFLPADLPVFNEKGNSDLVVVEAMVYNSLFPFLLREGMQKAAYEDEYQRRSLDLEERWKRFRERQQKLQKTPDVWNTSMRTNSIVEDSRTYVDESTSIGSLSISRSDRESVNTSKMQRQGYGGLSPSPLAMMSICEDGGATFRDWWIKWSDEAFQTFENPHPKTPLQESLAKIRSRAESQKLQHEVEEITRSPRSRTNWLEVILQRLNRPLIFPDKDAPEEEQQGSGVPLPAAARKDRRKFLC